MHSPSTPTPLATPDRDRLRHSLQQGRRLRLHGALIAGLTLMGLLASGALLRALGVEALSLRYALSLPLTYLLYLGLLRLWCGWLTRRSRSDSWSGDGLDLLVQGLLGKRESGGALMRSGGGGDFAGAGASGDFGTTSHLGSELGGQVAAEASPSLTVAAVRGSAHAGAIASEGLAAGPLLALLGLLLVLVVMLGLSVTTLFGVETLLAVSVEVGLAALAGSLAQQSGTGSGTGTDTSSWLRLAWRSTWRAALALLLVGILLGAALDRWLPQADSLPQALQLLSHRR